MESVRVLTANVDPVCCNFLAGSAAGFASHNLLGDTRGVRSVLVKCTQSQCIVIGCAKLFVCPARSQLLLPVAISCLRCHVIGIGWREFLAVSAGRPRFPRAIVSYRAFVSVASNCCQLRHIDL
eukprot:8863525-Pyramimonas_sp.AAC.1